MLNGLKGQLFTNSETQILVDDENSDHIAENKRVKQYIGRWTSYNEDGSGTDMIKIINGGKLAERNASLFKIIFQIKCNPMIEKRIFAFNEEIKKYGEYNICNTSRTTATYYQEIETYDLGLESIVLDILESTDWFLDNVLIWRTIDNGLISDMLEIINEKL